MKPVDFHLGAELDLDEAIAYYEAQRSGLGLQFEATVEKALDRIRRYPERNPNFPGTSVRKSRLRRFPFNVCYMNLTDRIWIVAIAHQKREPGYWVGRTTK